MHRDGFDILLLDDDRDLYDYYVILLHEHFGDDVRLYHCMSGGELPRALSEREYDIIILDQRLRDGERGLDLVPAIRRHDPHVVILMNSAYGSEGLAAEAIRHGVDDYIEGKKEDSVKLVESIRRAIDTIGSNRNIVFKVSEMIEGRRTVYEECESRLENIKKKIGGSIPMG